MDVRLQNSDSGDALNMFLERTTATLTKESKFDGEIEAVLKRVRLFVTKTRRPSEIFLSPAFYFPYSSLEPAAWCHMALHGAAWWLLSKLHGCRHIP